MRGFVSRVPCLVLAALAVCTLPEPVLIAPAWAKDSDANVVAGDLGAKIEKAADEAGGAGFWGAVLVSRGGEILLAKGYGNADFERAPNTPRTLFELASVSKHVTAAAVLHLIQKKKLALGETLGELFDDVPEDKQAITVHQFLTHTSGLTVDGVAYASPISRKEYVKTTLARPALALPGEEFKYNNQGYAMLAAIVERVSRKSFESYCERHLFKPARMKDTGFVGDKDLVKSKRNSTRGGDNPGTAAGWHYGWGYRGMGGVVTTVLDLHRWDRALRTDDILDAATRKIYYEPAKQGYACGWEVGITDRGTRRVFHSGSVSGYRTYLARFLEDDACVAVLGNDGEKAFAVGRAVEPLLFAPSKLTVTLQPARVDSRRVGVLEPDVRWDVMRKGVDVRIALVEGKKRRAEIRGASGFALGLAHKLEAVAQKYPAADGDEPSVRGRIDLSAYEGRSKVELTEQVEIQIKPYPSNPERPIVFLLQDQAQGRAAIIVEMNTAAAQQLIDGLRER